jgi:hypothetical protein
VDAITCKDILLLVFGALLSIPPSWLLTHIYYKKSLRQQADAASAEIEKLIEIASWQDQHNRAVLMQARIEECIKEYRRAGTPVRVIDTYNDLSNSEKGDLLDTVLLRARGRKASNNKYRLDGNNA